MSTLGSAGSTPLCRNTSNQISSCSSSARYISNITSFTSGLNVISRLRPVSFNWRDGGTLDLGLVAEEVAGAEPLLTSTNDIGQIEGVKYDRVGVVLVNAIKEQQGEIESQRKEIDALRREVSGLKALICAAQPAVAASLCTAGTR